MLLRCTALAVVLALAAVSLADWAPADDLPPGPYCGRTNKCCDGRIDQCAEIITPYGQASSLCYCDTFCRRNTSDDCCPDYYSVCLGINNQQSGAAEIRRLNCTYGNRHYNEAETRQDNCNTCTCVAEGDNGVWDCTKNDCLMDSRIVQQVNEIGSLNWRATNYSQFLGHSLDEGLTYRLGTHKPSQAIRDAPPERLSINGPLPRHFDARTKWASYITPIQDQGWCGSSWAMSTVAVASDRFGIMSYGLERVQLSAQQILSCNMNGQRTCGGGHVDRAWQYVKRSGLVDEECFPYRGQNAPKCHFKRQGSLRQDGCLLPDNVERVERYKVSPPHRVGDEADIMNEIQQLGPVQAVMKVRPDFFHYRGGIYEPTPYGPSHKFGYHSFRIMGWGEENGVKYWLAANSWGSWWGEKGYFRILRGHNTADIESCVLSVWAHSVRAPSTKIRRNNRT